MQTAIGDQLAKEILAGEVTDGDTVRVDRGEDGLIVSAAGAAGAAPSLDKSL